MKHKDTHSGEVCSLNSMGSGRLQADGAGESIFLSIRTEVPEKGSR